MEFAIQELLKTQVFVFISLFNSPTITETKALAIAADKSGEGETRVGRLWSVTAMEGFESI